jgi:hypothetical protein
MSIETYCYHRRTRAQRYDQFTAVIHGPPKAGADYAKSRQGQQYRGLDGVVMTDWREIQT